MISSKFTALLPQSHINKVIEVANRLKLNPNWLLAVMYFETGRTFDPSKKNQIGSVGLIQFTRDKAGVQYKTIQGKKYALTDLANMSFLEQMDVVEKYYKEAMGSRKVSSFIDTYLVTFFPAALGQADDFVFQTKGLSASLIATQNPVFDANKDNLIHKKEVTDYFRKIYNSWGFNFDSDINVGNSGLKALLPLALVVFFYTCGTLNEVINKFF